MLKLAKATAGLIGLCAISSASMAAIDFHFDASTLGVSGGTYTSSLSNQYTFLGSDNSTELEVSGWRTTSSSDSAQIVNRDTKLRHWSGLSLDDSSDEHGIDNISGYDFVVFSFDEDVSLTEFKMGYISNDWDTTILAYTGADFASLNDNLAGETISDLTSNGWDAIGHFLSTNPAYGSRDISAETLDKDVYSSYWAIGAYMPQVSAAMFGAGENAAVGSDYFKLQTATFEKRPDTPPSGGQTPAPATALLLLLGLPLIRLHSKKQ